MPQVSPFMVAPPSFAVAFRIHGYCCMYFYSVATPPLQVHFGLAAFVACAFMVAPPPLWQERFVKNMWALDIKVAVC